MITVELLEAAEGDCIFVCFDDIHILIDTGQTGVSQNRVIQFLTEKPDWNKVLDLLILTHIDNDHIGGARAFLDDAWLRIKEIWFNGYQHLPENTLHLERGQRVSFGETRMSVVSANLLSAVIHRKKVSWNGSFGGHAVTRNVLGPISFCNKIKIWVLNPGNEELITLKSVWNKPEQEIYRGEQATENAEFEELLALDMPISSTKTNDSSIVVIMEYEGKKLLFTGDASQNVFMQPLEEWCSIYNPSKQFDLIKIPHHGSERSTNADFYKKFNADYFLISSNGGRNGKQHPSKAVLAQIIKNNPYCHICFNYYTKNGYQYCEELLRNQEKFHFQLLMRTVKI